MPIIRQEDFDGRSVYVVYWRGRKVFEWLSIAQLYVIFELEFLTWIE